MGLRQFLQSHPRDRLVPDAIYWLGESYLQRSRPREAAEQFLKVSTEHARSNKAPDAMLKLGIALNALGARDQACATFAELGRKYPQARKRPSGRRARAEARPLRVTSEAKPLSHSEVAPLLEPYLLKREAGPSAVVLAVSGGPDSVALMRLAAGVAAAGRVPVTVATVDHGLRPESRAEAETVAAWAAELRLPPSHSRLEGPQAEHRAAGTGARGTLPAPRRPRRRSSTPPTFSPPIRWTIRPRRS